MAIHGDPRARGSYFANTALTTFHSRFESLVKINNFRPCYKNCYKNASEKNPIPVKSSWKKEGSDDALKHC